MQIYLSVKSAVKKKRNSNIPGKTAFHIDKFTMHNRNIQCLQLITGLSLEKFLCIDCFVDESRKYIFSAEQDSK